MPNGILYTNEGYLLVALSGTNQIARFSVRKAGVASDMKILFDLSTTIDPHNHTLPDGIAQGNDGNIYVAHYGSGKIKVIDLNGSFLGSLDAGHKIVSNLAFFKEAIYTTGSLKVRGEEGGIFRIPLLH